MTVTALPDKKKPIAIMADVGHVCQEFGIHVDRTDDIGDGFVLFSFQNPSLPSEKFDVFVRDDGFIEARLETEKMKWNGFFSSQGQRDGLKEYFEFEQTFKSVLPRLNPVCNVTQICEKIGRPIAIQLKFCGCVTDPDPERLPSELLARKSEKQGAEIYRLRPGS